MLGVSPKARKGAPAKLGSMKNPPVTAAVAPAAGGKVSAEEVWEVRPGGMLVQKRGGGLSDDEPSVNVKPVPTIRVKVKHAGVTHEIYISSEASFGELKKLVAAKTGLHPDDQKVLYKDKERDSKAFLDMAGVKDRSKVVVVEDPEAKARRLIEERRNGHLEKAAKAVAAATAEVDKLAPKVRSTVCTHCRNQSPIHPKIASFSEPRRVRVNGTGVGVDLTIILVSGCFSFRLAGGGAGRVGAEGGEGGGERRGAADGAAHERAAQARRGGRRRRRQDPEADAGEARAEVRRGARRCHGQERRHRPQIRREGRQAAAATGGAAEAAAAASTTQTASVPAAAAGGAAGAVGDVRPAVVAAVDVVGLVDDHRELECVVRSAAGQQARLDALLRTKTTRHRSPAQKAKRPTQTREMQCLCAKNCTPCPAKSDRVS